MSLSETAEITYGESVLHILAQNNAYGYEFQRFLQDWFRLEIVRRKEQGNNMTLPVAY